MKFRNPETGEVFDSLLEAADKFCLDHDCFWSKCPLDKANESRACWDWIQEYPIEAARLMGYEVVEEMRDPQLNEGEMDKEMEKNHFSTIIDLPKTEILAQLGEEAAELAQAALKLRRAFDGTNPTPVSEAEAWEALIEELSDVALCCKLLNILPNYCTMQDKLKRWEKRLEGKQ